METKTAAKNSNRKKSASPKTAKKKSAAPKPVRKVRKPAAKKQGGPVETIGYAAGATVGKLASIAGQTSRALKSAAEKVLDTAKKTVKKG